MQLTHCVPMVVPFPDSGYFMKFDTSSGPVGSSALLESRILYPKRDEQCLQFFYKMTGAAGDKLVIWIRTDDGTGTVRSIRKIHTITGILLLSLLRQDRITTQVSASFSSLRKWGRCLENGLCDSQGVWEIPLFLPRRQRIVRLLGCRLNR